MTEEITKNLVLCDEDWNCILMDCWEFDEGETEKFNKCEIYLKKLSAKTIKIFEKISQKSEEKVKERVKEQAKKQTDEMEMLVGDRQDPEVTKKELRLGMNACKKIKMN